MLQDTASDTVFSTVMMWFSTPLEWELQFTFALGSSWVFPVPDQPKEP